jgi:oligoribonuclease NrnB/cAMP/cGMP phosphodiesterase (DHH superfamily)
MKSKKDLVNIYYHKNCSDGFGAAWAAYKCFGNRACYIPVSHDDEITVSWDSINYFLDFSPKEKFIKDLEARSKELYIIDHHISSYSYLKDKSYYIYDIKHSGCVLAWKYFFPNEEVPKLLLYIEDRDLWKNSLPNFSDIFLFTNTFKYDFSEWDNLNDVIKNDFHYAANVGSSLFSYRDSLIDKMSENLYNLQIGGYKVKSLNSPVLQSYTLSTMYKKEPFMSCYYYDGERYIFSLRSSVDSDISMSDIAKIYGGGGHKNASGFSVRKLWHLNLFYYKWTIEKFIKSFLRFIKF